ncbi:DUF1963 domain-containing protein [Pseudomonas sp. LTJR-52]|uniref:DUF1963 domain-containing protein n=1 Tax=Pseudomonas sp. LTJR-52 TaxID=2479392 RepID=UPI000EFD976E|nr:DUF1963 domain-containing protein [Pseudomonas sp. LTJR-52]AYN96963.1 DUF1963 domain-containing protein [Pseudomonas sp. LTJR-52]
MDVPEIKRRLAKPATKFIAGGFRPTGQDDESWIGKVFLYRPDEAVPLDESGEQMLPLAQFHIPGLPFCSPLLSDTYVLTLFMSKTYPEQFETIGRNWLIREYGSHEHLERREESVPVPSLKPFPLRAELVDADFPLWDGGGVPPVLEEELLRLERAGEIESYYDIISHTYGHKIGGYPSFCQAGVDPGEGFEFVFQLSSDAKVGLNVVDNGSLMFWKHEDTGEWVLYYDFY